MNYIFNVEDYQLLRHKINNCGSSLLLLVLCYVFITFVRHVSSKNSHVPQDVTTWRDTLRFTNEAELILRGYNEYAKGKNKAFMANGFALLPPSSFSEARKMPPDALNFDEAAEDASVLLVRISSSYADHLQILLLRFSIGENHSQYLPIVAHDLVRNLNSHVEPLLDEIHRIFDEIFLPLSSESGHVPNQWHSIPFHKTILRMVGIAVSRSFVGKQLCRDERFTKPVAQFANGVIMQIFILRHLPGEKLKYWVAKLLPQERRVAALRELVRKPVLRRVEHIQNCVADTKDYTVLDKIVDTVVLKYFPGMTEFDSEARESILRISSTRLLALMFGAIDTTAMALCQAVYDLLGHPRSEYMDPLREEVNTTFEKNGCKWDLNSINELKLLDSFIKESQRLHSVAVCLANRKVIKPGGIKFSNGDLIPEGTLVSHPLYAVHRDPDYYTNPYTFDGFRFARSQDPEPKSKYGSPLSDHFLAFGHGRYACPGKAFALLVIKLMMIQLLTKYEFQEIERPKDWILGTGLLPDMRVKIMVRRADIKA